MSADKPSIDELCRLAREHLKARQTGEAMALFEQAIQRDPDHIAAHEGLAAICFARKDHDRAVQLFQRVVALDPRRVEPLINLGAAYNRQGKYAEAIKTLRTALQRDRFNAAGYYNLGFAQRNARQPRLAVSAFKEAIRLQPEMWEAHVNLGQTLLEMKNATQASLSFERALQLHPNSRHAQEGLATARNEIATVKHARSPFGRLVDMERVEQQASAGAGQAQFLSPEQRQQNRATALRFGKEIEQQSVLLFRQTKAEIGPAILALNRRIQSSERTGYGPELEKLQQVRDHFQKLLQLLTNKLTELDACHTSVKAASRSSPQSGSNPQPPP